MLKRIILLSIFFSCSALGGTADLSIEMEFSEVNGVVFEQQGEFVARITNNGPDFAAENAPFQNPITLSSGIIQDNGSFTPNIQFAAAAQNDNQQCFFFLTIGSPPPGGSVSYGYSIALPPIEANQTIECYGIFSRHFLSGTRDVNWTIRNNFDTDPVASNNTQTVTFGIPPKAVPVNNIFTLVLLFTLMLYFGYKSKYHLRNEKL
jgi:hypothetical protein